MSALSRPIVMSLSLTRSFAIAALLGATMLAGPGTPARADDLVGAPIRLVPVQSAPIQLAQATTPAPAPAASPATEAKPETVEQRITSLHAALAITSAEEANWNAVAKSMRDNAAAMQKLVADKTADTTQGMTAVDDLKTYEKFAQAHVDGLKSLTASFETLYKSMPAAQQKVADGVFSQARHHGSASHG
jgi:glutamine synthetase adenylyltransferase